MSVAIAHTGYDVAGGGEALAEELARMFDAPLYVGHGTPDRPGIDIREIAPESHLHRMMARGGAVRGIGHLLHWRDNADAALAEYDTVITSGNEPLWWQRREHQTVVAYTHSPPRWLYDLYHEVEGFVGRTYQQFKRRLYEGPAKRPDLFVANSDVVARRIRQAWNIPDEQIRVVYPPVQTYAYRPEDAETGDYYVTVSRLDGPKCIDEIVEAFTELGDDYHLRVVGKGPERERLEALAGENVTFTGYVSEARKAKHLAGAKGFVFAARNEDFGMAPVEAMAAGTPVIGVNEGFTQYQIVDGENGYTFAREGTHLREAIRRFERNGVTWSPSEIAEFADQFGVKQFREGMQAAVAEAERRSAVSTPWQESEPVVERPVLADGGDE